MLLVTTICGILVWGVLDRIQYQRLKSILYKQQAEHLNEEAQIARRLFDQYIISYSRAAKLFVSLNRFSSYVSQDGWLASPAPKYHEEVPPWLPDASVLRKFARVHYALLLDDQDEVREIYRVTGVPLPADLQHPNSLLRSLSSDQSFLTMLNDFPFIVTAQSFVNPEIDRKATLMFASPLNDDFLISSQGLAAGKNFIALMSGEPLRVLATNRADLVPAGSSLTELEPRFLITGKSFFDGSADLMVQFTTLFSKEEYENLSKNILTNERRQFAISALVFVLVLGFIMILITRQVRELTRKIIDFSQQVLNVQIQELTAGDEIFVLKKYFNILIEEIESSHHALVQENELLEKAHEDLAAKNRMIEENRKILQDALDEISKLIQSVASKKGFDVRFANPNLKRCYEVLSCSNSECPCHGKPPVRCWQIAGTYCLGDSTGTFASSIDDCIECQVYKEAARDPIYKIGEYFNNMMSILQRQHKELEQAYVELKEAQSQMLQREKMASIGQIAAGVAHEINNPVGYVVSNIGTLKKYFDKFDEFLTLNAEAIAALSREDIKTDLNENKIRLKIDYIRNDTNSLIKETLEGAERVKKIVQNLKNFSRLDEAEYKMADINAGLESTLHVIANEIKYKAKVIQDYGDLPMILCNLGQLNQVFMNILLNAAQAIETQGEITIITRAADGFITIAIADTGAGISPQNLSRIFEPFFTTKEVGKGTGLGLSIVYDIIRAHKGDIKAESELGKGSTFTISIPIFKEKTDKSS